MVTDRSHERELMVERQLRRRGIHDPRVLAAMATVPREEFLPHELASEAYDDNPLPIEAGQTISQPFIVALMIEALQLEGRERVLEIGTGSGYAAAVLACCAGQVFTIERHAELAELATARLARLAYNNAEVRHGDGTLGWTEHAPYGGIVVAAGGPDVPTALLDQLAIGGRIVIPVGTSRAQELVRVTRTGEHDYRRENLGPVRFVPLIGTHGWADARASSTRPALVSKLIRECAEPIARIDDAAIDGLLDRIGDAKVVLLGEATHGTSEFYRMRTRITQQLILRHGFTAVAVEADWPDASSIDRYIRNLAPRARPWVPFSRFPEWMWRNREVEALVEWLRAYNVDAHVPVSFSGLDLYSLFTSASEVVHYLDRVDPPAAKIARERYGRLTPWQSDPAAYGHAALVGRIEPYEKEIVAMLRDLLARRLDYASQDGDEFFDAAQNAHVVANAERYYRVMYYGSVESWNLRDQHMFDTLRAILKHRGEDAKVVVWEHNSHLGDAAATEMAARGEHNVGQLCRRHFGGDVYSVGFGTDHGVVAAAHDWDGPMMRMRVRPARVDSYERLCHDSRVPAFTLALRDPVRGELRDELAEPRLERAIGVVYRPDTELQSHYFQAVLPEQFDEYVWFDETDAVEPLPAGEILEQPVLHPFAL
ncbi:MAG: protein-L-isoaspartate(D-aspartate) O-methyltransferase [Acidobacteriota bacterium]